MDDISCVHVYMYIQMYMGYYIPIPHKVILLLSYINAVLLYCCSTVLQYCNTASHHHNTPTVYDDSPRGSFLIFFFRSVRFLSGRNEKKKKNERLLEILFWPRPVFFFCLRGDFFFSLGLIYKALVSVHISISNLYLSTILCTILSQYPISVYNKTK